MDQISHMVSHKVVILMDKDKVMAIVWVDRVLVIVKDIQGIDNLIYFIY